MRHIRDNWKVRKIDIDTIGKVVGVNTLITASISFINPAISVFSELDNNYLLNLVFSFFALFFSAMLLFKNNYRLKPWAFLFCVSFWMFVVLSFILITPFQLFIGSGLAFCALIFSIVGWLRSWIWR